MTDRPDFETRLEIRLRARAALASRPFDAASIAHHAIATAGPGRRIGTLAWPVPWPGFGWLAIGLLLAIALLGAVALVGAHLLKTPPRVLASSAWIAYSTATHEGPGGTDSQFGSDIYLVRGGAQPILIAGRQDGTVWNLCPTFSPDGRRIAFSVVSNQGLAIVVDGVDANGVSSDSVRISVRGSGRLAACPRWSPDGTRVAYLDGDVVAVRGLDGSTPATVAGDPRAEDFLPPSLPNGAILSPAGDRMAWLTGSYPGDALAVARRDGADARAIPLGTNPYAISAWSPDGRQVLLMMDVGGAFSMEAIAVDSPFDVTWVVHDVGVNGERSWPGWGDVSWQPVAP